MKKELTAVRLTINGIVQGVGFRPFIHQLASEYALNGRVVNTASGVSLLVEGEAPAVAAFVRDIPERKPPLARITEIREFAETPSGLTAFSIEKSVGALNSATLISPDVSVCGDCRSELLDPKDRRHRYPFINCTNCGPRYTIIDGIPYDRPNTSMKVFRMCERCQAEYDDPANRRFHAQPNACPVCGPQVELHDAEGHALDHPDPVRKAAQLLAAGKIVAIKGLGGFHLAVDAASGAAVARLRRRKHREEKPFALMVRDMETVGRLAKVTGEEAAQLRSHERPIVLLEKRTDNGLPEAVSPKNRYFGVMLPYTPLHYILMEEGPSALVMTSGNRTGEPLAIDNRAAFSDLAGIADYFLVHDREIYLRSDDSIVRVAAEKPRFIRRSRGYVPCPVFLAREKGGVLACGGEQKNTVCLTRGKEAFLSQHIGDLTNMPAYTFFTHTIDHMERILSVRPEVIAHDLHPDYLSTRYAKERTGVKMVGVQHHHAHIASCLAENGLEGPAIGLSFDGTGYGSDGHIWGGEVLLADTKRFTRAAHLAYLPMPGGGAAAAEPWRMGISLLYDTFGEELWDLPLPFLSGLDRGKVTFLLQMVEKGVNAPLTSSAGRLFDGVAAILGIRNRVSFEGQAAMELEMLAREAQAKTAVERSAGTYDFGWDLPEAEGPKIVRLDPLVRGVVSDLAEGTSASVIGMRFHRTLIRLFTELCSEIRKETGLSRVALSGGVFLNAILLEGFVRTLSAEGFSVYTHAQVPPGDGGLSLGQAVVAAGLAGS